MQTKGNRGCLLFFICGVLWVTPHNSSYQRFYIFLLAVSGRYAPNAVVGCILPTSQNPLQG